MGVFSSSNAALFIEAFKHALFSALLLVQVPVFIGDFYSVVNLWCGLVMSFPALNTLLTD